MNKTTQKIIIGALCASLLSFSSPFVPFVAAESITASNEIPAEQPKEEGQDDIKSKTDAILHPEEEKEEEEAPIPEDHPYIPKDTILSIELTEPISSKTMKKGNPVPLQLKDDLVVNDVVVAPAGTKVEGVVTDAKKNGMFGRSGKLEFSITSLETINGVKIPLQYVVKKEAGSDGGAVAVAAAVSVVGGLFMKGKNVSFDKGTLFDARVTKNTDLETTYDDLAWSMDPANQKKHATVIVLNQ